MLDSDEIPEREATVPDIESVGLAIQRRCTKTPLSQARGTRLGSPSRNLGVLQSPR